MRITSTTIPAWWLGTLLIAGAALGQAPASARFIARIAVQSAEDGHGKPFALITVNETPAVSLRTEAGGFSPLQRAEVGARRLTSLLQGGLSPQDLAAQPENKPDWEVSAGGGILLMATPQEAASHGMTPKALAQSWVRTLRTLLTAPPLTLSVHSLIVPLGETRTVRIGGAVLPSDIRVQDDDGAVGLSTFDPAQRTVTIRGRATGGDLVSVSPAPGVGGDSLTLPVTVLPYAGRVEPSVSVDVTGSPAPPALVTRAAYLGLTHALDLETGALTTLTSPPAAPTPLDIGGRTTEAFPLRLTGSGLLPVTARPLVTIINTNIFAQPPEVLLYSNNPEQITRAQTLFTGVIGHRESVRLDFHHQNLSGTLFAFHVDLNNEGNDAASVQVIAGLALPGGDTVQVGRRAGAAFLDNLNRDAGIVLNVPPHGSVPLVTQRLAPGLTVSGLMQIQSLTGGPLGLTVRVSGDTDAVTAPLWRVYTTGAGGDALAAPSTDLVQPSLSPATPEIFPDPRVSLSGSYTVNGRWAFITMGDRDALRAETGGVLLYGNYGADYDINVTLVNPTPTARTIGLFFRPEAGPAAAVFQVDNGPIQEYDPLSPPDERVLAQETVAAGATQVVHLRTIPLNGSAYPAQIVAHVMDQSQPPTAVAVGGAGKAGH